MGFGKGRLTKNFLAISVLKMMGGVKNNMFQMIKVENIENSTKRFVEVIEQNNTNIAS